MDKRLVNVLACPAQQATPRTISELINSETLVPSRCGAELEFRGESNAHRLLSGGLLCSRCGRAFPVKDEVPILVPPGTSMDGARWEGKEAEIAEWVPRHFAKPQWSIRSSLERDFITAAQATQGIVLDVASGPAGSFCVQVMSDGRTDRVLAMSDLGTPVMLAWRKHLRQVGWGDRCSNLVFDARRMPFRDGSVATIASALGFGNITRNKLAYADAARVLPPGGRMLDVVRLYEEGGPTQRHLVKVGHAGAAWSDYAALLEGLGFAIQRSEVACTGRGKSDPGDGLPLGDEVWEHRMVFAVRR